ncbi:HIT family protein [Terricaulis sp.]|jgi:histidine triad (HIT) family protein|uniref:HIT family protein n=1 Tax=Terricaulis sp. TaxID=2768686 RepID=UPI000A4BBEC6|nr:HIT family protein [Terricaulis sp.]MDZ4691971.1 HIT family protein [Terricaulis sp.]
MSLHGVYDKNNLFAKILRGEVPAVKVYEDDTVLAFMDLYPQSRGHVLIIPKGVEARNFLELPDSKVAPLMWHVQRLTKAVDKALKPDGITVTQFNGAPAGQTIFHLHWHIIPRYENVRLAGHGHTTRADIAELQQIATDIAAAL